MLPVQEFEEFTYIYRMTAGDKFILHIDDDPDDREMLSDALHDLNTSVTLVGKENGLAGLEYLCEAKEQGKLPCLVVLDINMPFMDGRQTLAKIREHSSLNSLRVLVYTSSSNPQDKAYFTERGVPFITKPATLSKLGLIAQEMIVFCD
jgi:CheY-like chemotaxis protein